LGLQGDMVDLRGLELPTPWLQTRAIICEESKAPISPGKRRFWNIG
jgi:hypothetical protein